MDQRTVWGAAVGSGKTTAAHADLLDYLRTLVYPTECELRLGRAGAVVPPAGAGDGSDLPLDEWPLAAADGAEALAAVQTLTGPPARDVRGFVPLGADRRLSQGADTTLRLRFVMPGNHALGSDHPGARPPWLAEGYRLTAAIADAADHRGRRMRIVFPRATYRCILDAGRFTHRLDLQAETIPLYTARVAEDTAR